MYCSKCGKESIDSASFCYGCGAQLVTLNEAEGKSIEDLEDAENRAGHNHALGKSNASSGSVTETYGISSNLASWRNAAVASMIGAGVAMLGFFLPWISLNANILGDMGSSLGGEISAWSLSFKLITFIPETIGRSSSSSTSSSSDAPTMLVFFIVLAVIDIIALILIPILCTFIGIHGYRMLENSLDEEWSFWQIKKIKEKAIIAVVPTVVFLILLQGILGFSVSGSVSLGLGIMGFGYWLSLLGLLGIIVSTALFPPKSFKLTEEQTDEQDPLLDEANEALLLYNNDKDFRKFAKRYKDGPVEEAYLAFLKRK